MQDRVTVPDIQGEELFVKKTHFLHLKIKKNMHKTGVLLTPSNKPHALSYIDPCRFLLRDPLRGISTLQVCFPIRKQRIWGEEQDFGCQHCLCSPLSDSNTFVLTELNEDQTSCRCQYPLNRSLLCTNTLQRNMLISIIQPRKKRI